MTIRDGHPAQPWPTEQDALAVPSAYDSYALRRSSDCPNPARGDVDGLDLAIGENGQGTAVR
jgi:hypothetical protein